MFLCSLAFLSLLYVTYDAGTTHFLPDLLFDQISYISQARHLSDYGHIILHGKFEGMGTTIFPSLLLEGKTRLHMPGFIAMLAISFKVFGFSGFSAILPNMLSFLGTTLLLFYVGNRLYSQSAGIWAAFIFLVIPVFHLFALSALMEMSVTFVCFAAFALLLHIPSRWRAISIPLLIGATYLFRQPSVLLLIPMLAFYYDQTEQKKIWHFVAIIASTLLLCNLISVWQAHEGLHYISYKGAVIDGHINYDNAYIDSSTDYQLGFWHFAKLFVLHAINNLKTMFTELSIHKLSVNLMLNMSLFIFTFFIIIVCIDGIKKIKTELFPIACGLFTLMLIGADVLIYNGKIQYIHRMSFFTLPFLFLQVGRMFASYSFSTKQRITIFTVFAIFCCSLSVMTAVKLKKLHPLMVQNQHFFEAIKPVKNKLLVADPTLTLLYDYHHYPNIISFVPKNRKTLILINQRYPIGTVVVNENDLKTKISEHDLKSIGLELVETRNLKNHKYFVYKARVN